jgi:Flp pilus assembly CpaE family ATPase
MKLHVISNDLELIEELRDIVGFQVKVIDKKDLNDSEADVIVVSNEVIDIKMLLSIKATEAKTFYLSKFKDNEAVSSLDNNLLSIRNVVIVPPKRTVKQIQEFILSNIYKVETENNVFTFFGADSKVGVTSIAQLTASYIAKRNKDKSVLLIFLDGQTGFDWVEDKRNNSTCLADIQVALKNNFLDNKSLKDNCLRMQPNLYLLKGEIRIDENVCYNEHEINSLINICKEAFDFIVIDAGNTMNLSLRMTYSALINSASNNMLVTDQLPKSYEMYKKGKLQVMDDLKIDKFSVLILNKYMQNNSVYKREEIVSNYDIPVLTALPYLDYYYQAAADKNLALFENDKGYADGILTIVKLIEVKQGIVKEDKKGSWFDIFKKFGTRASI